MFASGEHLFFYVFKGTIQIIHNYRHKKTTVFFNCRFFNFIGRAAESYVTLLPF